MNQAVKTGSGYATAIDHLYHGSRGISFDGSAGYDCDKDGIADANCFNNTTGNKKLAGVYDISASSSYAH